MNALTSRDDVFSQLHQRSLKAHGYRKKGHWSTREVGDLIHSFYLRASRFGSKDEAVFWIDVQVFSEKWHQLLFAPKPYQGPNEATPSLLSEDLSRMAIPPFTGSFVISAGSPTDDLVERICLAAEGVALPLLAKCSDYNGLLNYWQDRPEVRERYLVSAGLLRLLGRDEAARDAMTNAKKHAPHENGLKWLEDRERSLWQHAV